MLAAGSRSRCAAGRSRGSYASFYACTASRQPLFRRASLAKRVCTHPGPSRLGWTDGGGDMDGFVVCASQTTLLLEAPLPFNACNPHVKALLRPLRDTILPNSVTIREHIRLP